MTVEPWGRVEPRRSAERCGSTEPRSSAAGAHADAGPRFLEVQGLHAGYGPMEVLHGVDMVVRPGQIVGILGPNGMGKTTLLRAIAGLIPPSGGEIRFKGRLINRLPVDERVRLGVTLVPEGRILFAGLTVEENLLLGAYRLRRPRRLEHLNLVYDVFPQLPGRRRQLAGTLSGGQQQMLAIGRGLMARPELLLIDEFSLGLAPVVVESILEALARLHGMSPISMVIVEQDVAVGLHLASWGYVLESGRVVLEDAAGSLLEDARVRETYLGLAVGTADARGSEVR